MTCGVTVREMCCRQELHTGIRCPCTDTHALKRGHPALQVLSSQLPEEEVLKGIKNACLLIDPSCGSGTYSAAIAGRPASKSGYRQKSAFPSWMPLSSSHLANGMKSIFLPACYAHCHGLPCIQMPFVEQHHALAQQSCFQHVLKVHLSV